MLSSVINFSAAVFGVLSIILGVRSYMDYMVIGFCIFIFSCICLYISINSAEVYFDLSRASHVLNILVNDSFLLIVSGFLFGGWWWYYCVSSMVVLTIIWGLVHNFHRTKEPETIKLAASRPRITFFEIE